MTDAEADALPGADPANIGHPFWAFVQLARILREDDGFDRITLAASLLCAAQAVAAEDGTALGFAFHMEREALKTAAAIGAEWASTATMTRN